MAELNIRIDWSELDLYLHVNNVMIFKYIQAARINYCEKIGMDTLNQQERPGFIVAASNVLYKRKILYPGQLRVESHVKWIKNTSFQLDHIIYNEQNEPVVEAFDVVVVYDYANNTKKQIPVELRKTIEQFENKIYGNFSKDTGET